MNNMDQFGRLDHPAQWAVTHAETSGHQREHSELKRLLADGWEPFAVSREGFGEVMWLRKQKLADAREN